jgi:hypothetical protein
LASRTPEFFDSPATRVVVKVAIYYVALIVLGMLVRQVVPLTSGLAQYAIDPMFAGRAAPVATKTATAGLDQTTLAVTVLIAMVASALVSLPVAWVYQLTRAKRGYQQSVVQLLIILPIVVAGIVVLVKYSLTLAFSLAGIVAAVRFRNTLDDSKDAVYVFLATGVGLASGVDIPVAMTISLLFNATVIVLWYSDFGNSPIELEGAIAARRLRRAKQLARTGTFVAQIDSEVLRNMSPEQLEGVAERAWKRAHDDNFKTGDAIAAAETRLRLKTRNAARVRELFDPRLDDLVKHMRTSDVTTDADGVQTMDYYLQPKKSTQPDELLALARVTCGSDLLDVQLR